MEKLSFAMGENDTIMTMMASPPAAIELHLDREGFNCIDLRLRRRCRGYGGQGGGQNTGWHERIVGERGRKGHALSQILAQEIL